jgi:3-oxoacyl-[acyl-carrier protein] reductase
MNQLRTQGRSILISGGSRGLGLHLVEGFLKSGNRVATFARSETDAVRHLRDEYGDDYYFEVLDAVDQAGVQAFVSTVHGRFGSIDALVNNAAVGQDELLIHTSPERIAELVAINITAPILLTRLAARRMMLQPQRGCVVNITSICGSRGYAGLSVYAASKGALDAFTRSMARELGEAGIPFNSVAPGFFASEMSSVLLPEQMDAIRRRTPSGDLTNEENVLSVVDLLLSRETNIDGQTITVDGGVSI